MTTVSEMQQAFALQRHASREQVDVPAVVRMERLRRLQGMLDTCSPALVAAVEADFGMRSARLTELADLLVLRSQLRQALQSTPRWMRPRRVATPLHMLLGRARIERQPVGVVGVISPWNYPLQLALAPVIAALAAGNRVMLKPSEAVPHTAQALDAAIGQFFAPEELCVVQGGADVASVFAGLGFDHLVFTGSTAVGRRVAQTAASQLTPTTLELGGKSPCILDVDCDMAQAALRVAYGKLLNAGQTCVAPDYVLLPRGQEAAFERAYRAAVAQLYPQLLGNPDYAAILGAKQRLRLRDLLQQAQSQGARVVHIDPQQRHAPQALPAAEMGQRQMLPTLVWDVNPGMALMQEEIFGPILPVLTYEHIDEVIATLNAGERPLALYWFGRNRGTRDAVLRRTVSGGVTINDTLLHVAHDNLPFGGVGASGWGAYHGEHGFLRFSHQKSVFIQGAWGAPQLLYPPYGRLFDHVMAWMRRKG